MSLFMPRFLGVFFAVVAAMLGFTPVTLAGSVLSSYGHIQAAPTIAAILALVVGSVVCFFGYRLLRLTLFLSGFMVAGLIAAIIVEFAFASFSWMPTASWIAFVLAGVGGGLLAVFAFTLGVFLVGVLAGIMVAFLLQVSFAYAFIPSHPGIMFVIFVAVFGLIGGVLTWKLEKPLLMMATSFIGATSMIWGIGYFAGKYPNAADMEQFRDRSGREWIYNIPGAWWAYLTATLLLFVLGIWVQWRRSSKGILHRSVHEKRRTHGRSDIDETPYRRSETPLPTTASYDDAHHESSTKKTGYGWPANANLGK